MQVEPSGGAMKDGFVDVRWIRYKKTGEEASVLGMKLLQVELGYTTKMWILKKEVLEIGRI